MLESTPPVIYQLKIVLVGISPMIWRRIRVSSNSTIADLHYVIQIVMGWKEEHLHQFLIHGVHYGTRSSYNLKKSCKIAASPFILLRLLSMQSKRRLFVS